jgi:hypothetical protein
MVAIFAVGGLALVPEQFTGIVRANLWALPTFLGLIILGLFAILAPPLMATRSYRRNWRTEHPNDAEVVGLERRANEIAASSPESKAARETYRRQSGKFALLTLGPLLLGFIPLIFIDTALGISGSAARVEIVIYFALYFTAFVLLSRRSGRRRRRLLKNTQLPIRSFPYSREDQNSTDSVGKLKGATDADLELCPHCGSAVHRGLGLDCPICGQPLK